MHLSPTELIMALVLVADPILLVVMLFKKKSQGI